MNLQHRIESRFIPEPNTGCFLWLGTLRKDGYGQISIRREGKQKFLLAHRAYYELMCGPVDGQLTMDHLCRVRCCVNPDHLEPVSRGENTRRGGKIQRQLAATHCPQGHPYSGVNLKLYKGARMCKRCNTEHALVYYHKNKGKR